jgi:hypothetical protein
MLSDKLAIGFSMVCIANTAYFTATFFWIICFGWRNVSPVDVMRISAYQLCGINDWLLTSPQF